MAEFCKDCSNKLGIKQASSKPLFCENCKTYYPKLNLLEQIKRLFKSL